MKINFIKWNSKVGLYSMVPSIYIPSIMVPNQIRLIGFNPTLPILTLVRIPLFIK